MINTKKREYIIEVKIVVDGETPQELFECLGGTIENIRDTLCEYGRVDDFKLYERAVGEEGGCHEREQANAGADRGR